MSPVLELRTGLGQRLKVAAAFSGCKTAGVTMIKFQCPGCGNRIQASDSSTGKTGKCKKCGTEVQVPRSIPKVATEKSRPVANAFSPGLPRLVPRSRREVLNTDDEVTQGDRIIAALEERAEKNRLKKRDEDPFVRWKKAHAGAAAAFGLTVGAVLLGVLVAIFMWAHGHAPGTIFAPGGWVFKEEQYSILIVAVVGTGALTIALTAIHLFVLIGIVPSRCTRSLGD